MLHFIKGNLEKCTSAVKSKAYITLIRQFSLGYVTEVSSGTHISMLKDLD